MLEPKRPRRRKVFRLRSQNKGVATRGISLAYGDMGIKAITGGEISARQIEAARRAISRAIKRGGKVWIRIFPDKILTAKGAEVPMGSGKGAPDKWVAQVKPGRIIFELSGAEEDVMRNALKLAAYKLCVKCKIVSHEV